MENETTKILGLDQNSSKENVNESHKTKDEKKVVTSKKSHIANFAAQTGATAMGAAVGTGAAMMADNLHAASVEDNEVLAENNVPDETEEVLEPINVEPQQANEGQEVSAVAATSHASTAHAVPENANYVDDGTQDVGQAGQTENAAAESEVHVVGVAVQNNGQGGMATIAHLQSDDDAALVVDVESDGRLDYVIHDDNRDGQIDNNEWHDISNENIATAQVVGAYVEEANNHGAEAVVANLDSGENAHIVETEDGYAIVAPNDSTTNDNLQTASSDDMPDYMNHADAGMMDV